MSNYAAVVVQIESLRKHSNADRLQIANIFQNDVIVGLDTKVGDVGLFFPLESQLGEKFAEVNDLIRRKDENGKNAGGMFDKNRRVRAQTLRGERSMGFFCPLSYLLQLPGADGVNELIVGTNVETFVGHDVSKKFVIPSKSPTTASKGGKKAEKKVSRLVADQFRFHFDTAQLGRNLFKIQPDDLLSISWKQHGTSVVFGNVLTKRKLSLWEKALDFLGVNLVKEVYDVIVSSRKVVKNDVSAGPGYYSRDIWMDATKPYHSLLRKGETVYAEICGYIAKDTWIQKDYDYGCLPGEHKMYVYRITQTNIDGVVTELPWHQVVDRSKQMGLEVCPEIYYGKASGFLPATENIRDWQEAFYNKIAENYVHDQDSIFCKNKVPEEGVIVRIERGDGIENFKFKSFAFLGHETKELDTGVADIESTEATDESTGVEETT